MDDTYVKVVIDCSTGLSETVPMTDDEIAARQASVAAEAAAAPKLALKAQIVALEKTITDRRVREAILGTDNGWLQNTNAQIATIRAQLDALG